MSNKLCLSVYAITIFISAFLLFSIQPMFTKMVLPMLGGSPMVWNTAMVFFQTVLLVGYLYVHLTSKLKNIKSQIYIHILILLTASIFLPIAKAQGWEPPTSDMPPLWLLVFFTVSIGLPFFAISATAPLIQRWFSFTEHEHAKDPYFLYGASNIGSILALISYPFVIERIFKLSEQGKFWGIGYAVLVLCIGICAIYIKKIGNIKSLNTNTNIVKTNWKTKSKWILYAFIPSSLLLAVTSHISVDIASFPLLWVIPLAIYLLTFVITFAKKPIISHKIILFIAPAVIAAGAVVLHLTMHNITYEIAINLLILFIIALTFHGELVKNRPSVNNITEFYLWMSFGGMLGGVFNSLIAPLIFNGVYEYYLIIFIAALFLPGKYQNKINKEFILPSIIIIINSIILITFKISNPLNEHVIPAQIIIPMIYMIIAMSLIFVKSRVAFKFSLVVLLVILSGVINTKNYKETVLRKRSFFSTYRVLENEQSAILVSGKIIHGVQIKKPEILQTAPLSYYNKKGPVGDIFNILDPIKTYQEKIGVVGLGTGNLSCYAKPGRSWTFFEIDPLTIKLAKNTNYFHYLEKCSANTNIILGDARLSLEKEQNNKYDAIFLDAFSSDAIPMHLLTKEAIDLYLQKIKSNGILAIHISNKFLDLTPILAGYIEREKVYGFLKNHKVNTSDYNNFLFFSSSWIVISKDKNILSDIENSSSWMPLNENKNKAFWTDDFSNIIPLIK